VVGTYGVKGAESGDLAQTDGTRMAITGQVNLSDSEQQFVREEARESVQRERNKFRVPTVVECKAVSRVGDSVERREQEDWGK